MGCWNGTCMISNLPIIAGEEIKLVILHNKYSEGKSINPLQGRSAYVYPTDLLSPAFLAIDGKYDDYGGIEEIQHDWNTKIILDEIQSSCSKFDLDGKIKDSTEASLEEILDSIERGNLKLLGKSNIKSKRQAKFYLEEENRKNLSQDQIEEYEKYLAGETSERWIDSPFSFVMIRKDIWDHIMTYQPTAFWNERKEYDENGERIYEITPLEFATRTFNEQIKNMDAVKELMKENENERAFQLSLTFSSVFNSLGMSGIIFRCPQRYSKTLHDETISRDDIFQKWYENLWINSYLGRARIGWTIQPGAGSQWSGWEDSKVLAEKIIQICDSELEEQEENE